MNLCNLLAFNFSHPESSRQTAEVAGGWILHYSSAVTRLQEGGSAKHLVITYLPATSSAVQERPSISPPYRAVTVFSRPHSSPRLGQEKAAPCLGLMLTGKPIQAI